MFISEFFGFVTLALHCLQCAFTRWYYSIRIDHFTNTDRRRQVELVWDYLIILCQILLRHFKGELNWQIAVWILSVVAHVCELGHQRELGPGRPRRHGDDAQPTCARRHAVPALLRGTRWHGSLLMLLLRLHGLLGVGMEITWKKSNNFNCTSSWVSNSNGLETPVLASKCLDTFPPSPLLRKCTKPSMKLSQEPWWDHEENMS